MLCGLLPFSTSSSEEELFREEFCCHKESSLFEGGMGGWICVVRDCFQAFLHGGGSAVTAEEEGQRGVKG